MHLSKGNQFSVSFTLSVCSISLFLSLSLSSSRNPFSNSGFDRCTLHTYTCKRSRRTINFICANTHILYICRSPVRTACICTYAVYMLVQVEYTGDWQFVVKFPFYTHFPRSFGRLVGSFTRSHCAISIWTKPPQIFVFVYLSRLIKWSAF